MGNPKEAPKHFLSGNLSRRSILALGTSALAAACASDAPSNTSINAQVQASVQAGVKATGTAQARLTPTPDTRFPTAITRPAPQATQPLPKPTRGGAPTPAPRPSPTVEQQLLAGWVEFNSPTIPYRVRLPSYMLPPESSYHHSTKDPEFGKDGDWYYKTKNPNGEFIVIAREPPESGIKLNTYADMVKSGLTRFSNGNQWISLGQRKVSNQDSVIYTVKASGLFSSKDKTVYTTYSAMFLYKNLGWRIVFNLHESAPNKDSMFDTILKSFTLLY